MNTPGGTLAQATRRLSRRRCLQAGTLGLAGLSLADLIRGRACADDVPRVPSFGRAKSCILLFMWGGPAHQDTWDPKPDAPAEVRGEFRSIATRTPGIHIAEHFPQLAQRTDRLCLVRSMTHGNADHTTSTHFLLTGQEPPRSVDRRAQWPHMGAVLARLGARPWRCLPSSRCGPKCRGTCHASSKKARGNSPAGSARSTIP